MTFCEKSLDTSRNAWYNIITETTTEPKGGKEINMDNFEIIRDALEEMLDTIAHNNHDFVCSCCIELKDSILELARAVLGADMAGILETSYDLTIKELQEEDE